MKLLLSTLLLAAFSAIPAFSASPAPVPTATYRADPGGFRGDSASVRVQVIIPKGWHIQSDAPLDEFLIPTEIKASGAGLRFGKAVFPKPLLKDFPALGGKVALFEDTVNVRVPAHSAKAKANPKALNKALEKSVVTLRYQACNDSQCLPPKEIRAVYQK
jgi:hypothetical protein